MKLKSGYNSNIVAAFLDAHGDRRDGELWTLNGIRIEYSMRQSIKRWEREPDLVPLGRLDRLLMHHGFMLYELDHWAQERFGITGWLDPYEEPLDLAI